MVRVIHNLCIRYHAARTTATPCCQSAGRNTGGILRHDLHTGARIADWWLIGYAPDKLHAGGALSGPRRTLGKVTLGGP